MHKIGTAALLCAALSILGPRAQADGGIPIWTNRYNGPGFSTDVAVSVGLDASGNVFVTGYSANNNLDLDYATIKYSNSGVALWTNRYNGAANSSDQPATMVVDSSGDVIVTGFSSTTQGLQDYLSIKYSGSGLTLWTNSYNGPGNSGDFPSAMAVDSNGNVFVTGRSLHSGGTNADYATVAYSSTGAPLWTNRYNGPGDSTDFPTDIAVSSAGDVFVTGYSWGGASSYDFATIKYSGVGVALWTNRYNGPANGSDFTPRIALDSAGNMFVAGYSSNTGTFYDYATIAYSGAGVPLWTNFYNGPGNTNDYVTAIAVDSAGDVFVTGSSYGIGSGYDFATVAYSNNGAALWTNRYNGSGNGPDSANRIAVDKSGNVVVAGYATGSNGNFDYATVAYSGSGVPLWTNTYNGPGNGVDNVLGIAVDAAGAVFVTGQSTSTAGTYDYATIKYSSAVPPVFLAFQNINNQLVLSWTSTGFSLQSAPIATGAFTNVAGATSPYTNSLTAPQQYFRLQTN